ncbi:paraquat-inducible protein A [Sulfurimonas sp.]|uniref:paraquat-inducible protein A n=1 Tax=Sulfurimonas sp. TaxID=2022749 RepID=UPI0039E60662
MSKQAEENKAKKFMDAPVEEIVYLGFKKLRASIFNNDATKMNKAKSDQIIQKNKKMMNQYVVYYFVFVVMLLFTYFFHVDEIFIFTIITASLISWFVGILAPIMTIEVFKDLPVVGYTIFKYESKSIWATIKTLWDIDRYFIAVMVGLFSVVIPVIKTFAVYISIFYKKSLKIMNFIGKWSMADVFIVALLLANLTLNTDEYTDAEVQIALYFFAMYVIFSIIATFVAHRHVEKIAQGKA